MPSQTTPDPSVVTGAGDVYALQQELRLLRARLAQREAALAELNRRLRRLEQQHGSAETDTRQRLVEVERRAQDLEQAIDALCQTKTFRYTEGLRRLYGRLLIGRPGS